MRSLEVQEQRERGSPVTHHPCLSQLLLLHTLWAPSFRHFISGSFFQGAHNCSRQLSVCLIPKENKWLGLPAASNPKRIITSHSRIKGLAARAGARGNTLLCLNAYLCCQWLVDAVHKFVHMFKVFCHLRGQNHVDNSLA